MSDALDHTEALAQLSPQDRVMLTRKDTLLGLRHLAMHLGAILMTGSYIALQGPFWGLVLVPHGILLVFLFTLAHECTHATPFGPRWMNALVGMMIAPVLALPFTWFRYFHLAHHRHTNDPKRDPELEAGRRPTTWGTYLSYLSGYGYWKRVLPSLWAQASGDLEEPYLPESRHNRIIIEAQFILVFYIFAAASLYFTPVLIWVWIVPVLLGQPFLRVYLLAEHGHCPPVTNMLENSRTTLTSRFVRWLAWNMPYHAEHHAYPAVPFHKLPELHDRLRPHLQSVSKGYGAFHREYASKLKL